MLRVLILALALCAASALGAQKDHPYAFGEIPKDDLTMTTYERDSLAPALVLVNYGSTVTTLKTGGYILRTDRHRRIKILKPAGLAYADVEIPYFHAGDMESVYNVRAQTIAPAGTVHPVSQKDIFREKINDRWSRVKFALPNATVGSIIEWEWSVNAQNIILPDSWALNHHGLLIRDDGTTEWIGIVMPNFPIVMGYDLSLEGTLVQVVNQPGGVLLSYSLDIKKDFYPPEEYEALRALFAKLAASLEEPVVLRRKS